VNNQTSDSTKTETSLSYRSVRYLAKPYLNDFQAIDPNITYRDLTSYISSLNASTLTEAETGLLAYLASLQASPVNQSPTINGSPTERVAEGEYYQFVPSANDPDGDSLVFSILNKPHWAVFDSTNGKLSGTPGQGTAGSYDNVLISVSDGDLTVGLPAFSITVNSVIVTGPPVLLSATVAGSDIVLAWEQKSTFPDGGFDLWIDTVDTSEKYRTTSMNATLSGLDPTLSHCFQVEARYPVLGEFYLSNQVCSIAQKPNQPPVISGSPASSVTIGASYSFTPSADDADGDQLAFSVINLPAWANFDSATGTLSGVPGEQDVGNYANITILVSDGAATVSLSPFTVQVETIINQQSASVTLSWSPPATRSDGTALAMSEIDGYRIYIGETAATLSPVTDINDSTLTMYTLTELSAGSYFFAVTSYDMDGNESVFSNIVNKSTL